ncbi:lipase 1 [Niveomyces insectorum RCEF 264]|uniref:Lipase 1 n=1 Tax=Niveomyces insectorum RCEF 264 TaxID=1081102 RepID=A0A162JBD6_9HYPO|nr:lipase 1 [Niveomyces insectorum RCEF 264]
MRCLSQVVLATACLNIRAVVAAPLLRRASCATNVTDEPIPPSEDPWYTAPYEFEKEAPGTILRVRPAPGNLTTLAGNSSAAYNILYRTTDSRYKPTWAVTTLFVPVEATASLLSYQIPYDSAFIDASPSYALYAGVSADISNSLGKGWYVNVPDYEGPLASFTAGVMSGHATLDSVRAVLSGASRFHLPSNVTSALWGYSGGALASEWAAELQVQYAPELNISGAALGGLTPNVSSVLETIYTGIEAGLAPAAIIGLCNQYPDVKDYMVSKLKTSGPYNGTTFMSAVNMTLNDAISAFAFKNISEYFVDGLADIFNPITEKAIYNDGVMGYHGIPQFPLYVYKAVHDEVSPINDTDKLVDEYCNMGVNILYQRNSVGGHSADSINGRPAAEAWLNSVFNGTYADSYSTRGCTIEDVAVNITSSSI